MLKVRGSVLLDFYVDPILVVENLLNEELKDSFVVENNGKFYKVRYEPAGTHSMEVYTEISKEDFDYINSLNVVLKTLKNRTKNK